MIYRRLYTAIEDIGVREHPSTDGDDVELRELLSTVVEDVRDIEHRSTDGDDIRTSVFRC